VSRFQYPEESGVRQLAINELPGKGPRISRPWMKHGLIPSDKHKGSKILTQGRKEGRGAKKEKKESEAGIRMLVIFLLLGDSAFLGDFA